MNNRAQYCVSLMLVCLLGLAGCAGSPTQESTGEYVDDSVVTTKVKTALIQDEQVDGGDIQVKTFKGVVQLGGFADSRSQSDRAMRIAERIEGVRDVKNDIRIKVAAD